MGEYESKQSQKTNKQIPAKKQERSAAERREGRHFGDACVRARIVQTQIETDPRSKKDYVKLGLIVPPGVDVATDAEAQVTGVPSATLRIVSVVDKYVIARTDESINLDMLKGHSEVVIACQASAQRATAPVTTRIVKRHVEGGNTVVTMAAGKLHGVMYGMKGHVAGNPKLSFTINESLSEFCSAVLNGAPADAKEVVITP